mgnify:CR=1 FL=1
MYISRVTKLVITRVSVVNLLIECDMIEICPGFFFCFRTKSFLQYLINMRV